MINPTTCPVVRVDNDGGKWVKRPPPIISSHYEAVIDKEKSCGPQAVVELCMNTA